MGTTCGTHTENSGGVAGSVQNRPGLTIGGLNKNRRPCYHATLEFRDRSRDRRKGFYISYEFQLYGTYAWQVKFRDGQVDAWETVEHSDVRCARSDWNTQPDQSERFVRFDPVENMAVVIDRFTGLMWQGCQNGFSGSDCEIGTNPQVRYWYGALRMCEDLDWGGYDDWYLPNVREGWKTRA